MQCPQIGNPTWNQVAEATGYNCQTAPPLIPPQEFFNANQQVDPTNAQAAMVVPSFAHLMQEQMAMMMAQYGRPSQLGQGQPGQADSTIPQFEASLVPPQSPWIPPPLVGATNPSEVSQQADGTVPQAEGCQLVQPPRMPPPMMVAQNGTTNGAMVNSPSQKEFVRWLDEQRFQLMRAERAVNSPQNGLTPGLVPWLDEQRSQLMKAEHAAKVTAADSGAFVGVLAQFSPIDKVGFIECKESQQQFGSDVAIHQDQSEGIEVGDTVVFRVTINGDGMAQASFARRLKELTELRSKIFQVETALNSHEFLHVPGQGPSLPSTLMPGATNSGVVPSGLVIPGHFAIPGTLNQPHGTVGHLPTDPSLAHTTTGPTLEMGVPSRGGAPHQSEGALSASDGFARASGRMQLHDLSKRRSRSISWSRSMSGSRSRSRSSGKHSSRSSRASPRRSRTGRPRGRSSSGYGWDDSSPTSRSGRRWASPRSRRRLT